MNVLKADMPVEGDFLAPLPFVEGEAPQASPVEGATRVKDRNERSEAEGGGSSGFATGGGDASQGQKRAKRG